MKKYENATILDHPLVNHKIAILRNEKTSMKEFRELIEEITTLMTFECLKEGVPTVEVEVKTPLEVCKQHMVKDNSIVIETSADRVRVEFAKFAISTNNTAEKEAAKKRAEAAAARKEKKAKK